MRWPWVSRESYEMVLAVKEELLLELRAQIATLEQRLKEPVKVTVQLPPDFAVIQPAIVAAPSKTAPQVLSRKRGLAEMDLANLDENNLELMAKLAAQWLGRKAHNRQEAALAIRQVMMLVKVAREEKLRGNAPSEEDDEVAS